MKGKCQLHTGFWYTNLFLFVVLLTVISYYAYIL